MKALSENTRGAVLMMGAMAAFTCGDTCVKAIGAAMPLSQILVLRGIFAALFIALLCWRLGAFRVRIGAGDWGLMILRGLAEVASAYFFLTALRNMPLANLTALLQMLPLTITLGAALFFGERVGWRRWLAIAMGFAGMLLIVRPGTEGFNVHSVYGLIAVAFVTLRDLVTRRISAAVPSMIVTLVSAVMVLLLAGGWSLGQDWAPLGARDGWLLAGATVAVIVGYSLSVMVMRVGEVGVIAPFRFTGLIWALVLGLAVFGDWPRPPTLAGAALIVGMGLFTFWREAQLRRRVQPKTVRI